MTKIVNGTPTDRRRYPRAGGFYVPHARVGFDNRVVDPITGEVRTLESRTKQSFVAECDINNIIKEFKVTRQIRHISAKAALGTYEDLPEPQEFQDSLNIIIAAEHSFASLPSQVRDRFANDPQRFLEFMGNPSNQDEIIRLGLGVDKRPPPPPPPSPPPSDGQKNGPSDKQ